MQTGEKQSIHDFKVESLDGGKIDFSEYKGKWILVVNTASECGCTPQYAQLEELHNEYANRLVVVGFPANNFGNQEPGSNEDIAEFCERNFGVSFPMAAKVSVEGENRHPLFEWLTTQDNPDFTGKIRWNFEKFLLDENGQLVHRYRSEVSPLDVDIPEVLDGK